MKIRKLMQQYAGGIKFKGTTVDIVVQCVDEFLALVSSEANEVCNRGKKRKIVDSHVTQALKDLEFTQYVTPVEEAMKGDDGLRKRLSKERKKKFKKLTSGADAEELRKKQLALFAKAKQSAASRQHS